MNNWGSKIRLGIGLLMLLIGFIGLIITSANKQGGWDYWRWTAVAYALLSISMNWHLKKIGWKKELFTIWQEILHWSGLLLSIWLISFIVRIGQQDRFEASLEVLILLALTTYLAGVYIETSFIPIGLLLGLFAAGLALFDEYLYAILIPLTILGILYMVWESRRARNLS